MGLSRLDFPVPEHGRSVLYSFGGIVFVGFVLMVFTGFILSQLYNPLPQQAYQSLERIQKIGWASYLRALHFWFAQGVLAALILHTARVFVTGAYKHPRQVTWWIGVALLATMMMGSYFSGTVLKWDQEGSDALNHYKELLRMLGPIGALMTEWLPGSTPMNLRVYVSHITIFPVLIVLLIIIHFYLIHVLNLAPTFWGKWSSAPAVPAGEVRGRFSEHARTILLASLAYYGSLAVLAIFVRAPLMGAPSGHEEAVKPPWPFLWMYWFENVWGIGAVLYISTLLFGFLLLVPLIDRGQERRLDARKGILGLGGLVALSLIGLTLYGWVVPPQRHQHSHGHEEETAEGTMTREEDAHSHDEGDHPHAPPAAESPSGDHSHDAPADHDHPEGADHHD